MDGEVREIKEKEKRIRNLLQERKLDAVFLSKLSHFAWMTCGGDSHVVMASEMGIATVVITKEKKGP